VLAKVQSHGKTKDMCLECLHEQDEGSTWEQQANDVWSGGKKRGACTPSVLGLSSTTASTAFCVANASRAVVGAGFVSTSFSAASASRDVVGARFVSTESCAASASRAEVRARTVSTERSTASASRDEVGARFVSTEKQK
jgi:hypothetical protein